MTATLKYSLSSAKKMELIAKMVRWAKVDVALRTLKFLPKKGWQSLYKLINSAIANAVHNGEYSAGDLFVERIEIGRWPKLKRYRFASRSRVHKYNKYRSFVRVKLWAKA